MQYKPQENKFHQFPLQQSILVYYKLLVTLVVSSKTTKAKCAYNVKISVFVMSFISVSVLSTKTPEIFLGRLHHPDENLIHFH